MTFFLGRLSFEKCVDDSEWLVFGFEATGETENVAGVVEAKALCGFDGEADSGTDSVEFIGGDADSFGTSADENADGTRIVANDGGDSGGEDGIIVGGVDGVSAEIFNGKSIIFKMTFNAFFECKAGVISAEIDERGMRHDLSIPQ